MSTPAISDKNGPYFQAIVPGVAGGESVGPGQTHFQAFTNTAEDSLPFHAEATLLELFATQDCWVLMKESTSAAAAAIPTFLCHILFLVFFRKHGC